jgi:hypothetical protein
VEEALKDGKDAIVPDLDAAEVLQPCIGAFDFPAFAVAAELTFVFKSAMAVVAAVRSDQFGAALFQPQAQRVGVVTAIGNHAPQAGARASTATVRHFHLFERAFRKPVFGDLRGRKLRSDRYAAAVDHHHALRTFPTTCLADPEAPFFAVRNVASRNASSQSNSLRSSIWASFDRSSDDLCGDWFLRERMVYRAVKLVGLQSVLESRILLHQCSPFTSNFKFEWNLRSSVVVHYRSNFPNPHFGTELG